MRTKLDRSKDPMRAIFAEGFERGDRLRQANRAARPSPAVPLNISIAPNLDRRIENHRANMERRLEFKVTRSECARELIEAGLRALAVGGTSNP